jgi:hypothetical protein
MRNEPSGPADLIAQVVIWATAAFGLGACVVSWWVFWALVPWAGMNTNAQIMTGCLVAITGIATCCVALPISFVFWVVVGGVLARLYALGVR